MAKLKRTRPSTCKAVVSPRARVANFAVDCPFTSRVKGTKHFTLTMNPTNTSPQRRDSGLSFICKVGKRLSFKDEAEKRPPPPKPVLKEAYYSTYELTWEKLKAYLEWKFPDTPFGDRNVSLF